MKRCRFGEEQITALLKEHEAGPCAQELCRKHRISGAMVDKWRSKSGGREVSDARWLKASESENARLKKVLAGQMTDAATPKEKLGASL